MKPLRPVVPVVAVGVRNSALVEFHDGYRVVTSCYAVTRKRNRRWRVSYDDHLSATRRYWA